MIHFNTVHDDLITLLPTTSTSVPNLITPLSILPVATVLDLEFEIHLQLASKKAHLQDVQLLNIIINNSH